MHVHLWNSVVRCFLDILILRQIFWFCKVKKKPNWPYMYFILEKIFNPLINNDWETLFHKLVGRRTSYINMQQIFKFLNKKIVYYILHKWIFFSVQTDVCDNVPEFDNLVHSRSNQRHIQAYTQNRMESTDTPFDRCTALPYTRSNTLFPVASAVVASMPDSSLSMNAVVGMALAWQWSNYFELLWLVYDWPVPACHWSDWSVLFQYWWYWFHLY